MQKQKGILALAGIIIIIVFAVVLFGGVFIYKNRDQNQNISNSKHNSKHIYLAETIISGKDAFNGIEFTKKISLPKIRSINNANTSDDINKVLSFKNVTGIDLQDAEVKASSGGLVSLDYQINYDKNNLLNISFNIAFMGAYPSETTKNYSIDLSNGEIIKPSEIFYQDKISDLLDVLNIKLQDNINQKISSAIKENPSGSYGECSEKVINGDMQIDKEYNADYGKFTKENIAGFKITSTGVEFTYDFGFAHVIKACEPIGTVILNYDQLKKYIRPDGLLAGEIK